jgi:FkbM family methyltransferase
MLIFAYKKIPSLKIKFSLFTKDMLKDVISFSLFAYIVTFSNMIIFKTDQMVIAMFGTVAFTALYQISSRLADMFRQFSTQFYDNLNPIASVLFTKGDKDNLSVLKRKFRSNGNIVLIPKGLWEDNRKLFFVSSENTMNSFIVENLEEVKGKKVSYIEVVSIDEFFKSEGDFPDFIKMDIEGSEIEALKGARDTISIQAPRLAISIYHKASDLWEIPLLIKNLNPKYKLFIGHHSFFWAESVVYAKQEER